jgi:hemerythrin-like domain-containing protein
MKESIRIVKDEHRSISTVLHALKHLTRITQDASIEPEFKAIRAMIRYIDEYPERLHHPKEERFLFARLATTWPASRPLIERLESEHREGARLVRELERALLLFEDDVSSREGRTDFADMVDQYAQFHWDHMRLEEEELLPLAERYFTPQDWSTVDEGFSSNTDPIAQVKENDFQALFSRLVRLAPEPVGLGEPWKKVAPVAD